MAQQPAELSPLLVPGLEQPRTPTQGTPPATPTAEPTMVLLTSAMAPDDPPQPPKKKKWMHRALAFAISSLIPTSLLTAILFLGGDSYKPIDGLPKNESGVAILGDAVRFDSLGTQEVSVRWYIVGYGDYMLETVGGSPAKYMPVDRAVDVYLDDASNTAFSYDPTRLPIAGSGGKLGLMDMVSFDTDHKVETGDRWCMPFDHYYFTSFLFAVEKATNKSVPIVIFAVGDAGPGAFSDFTTFSETVPSRSNFTYEAGDGPITVEVGSNTTFVTIKHSTRARVLTVSMFAINWVLTLCSVVIALTVVIREEMRDGVAFLPVTIILSIPAIRSLYVGSPPFGIYLDMAGFFPQMLTVVLSTLAALSLSIRDRGDSHKKAEV